MARLIDADEMEKLGDLSYEYNPVADGSPRYRAEDVWGRIDEEPTVDVPEVVWCKDCKMEFGCRVAQWLGENGFCSYGERK